MKCWQNAAYGLQAPGRWEGACSQHLAEVISGLVEVTGGTIQVYAATDGRRCSWPLAEADTVTVTHHKPQDRYTLAFSRLPGQVFGPWPFSDTVRDLRVSALLSAAGARDLVMDAAVSGSATAEVDR